MLRHWIGIGCCFVALLGFGISEAHAGSQTKPVTFTADEQIPSTEWDSGWVEYYDNEVTVEGRVRIWTVTDHVYSTLPGDGQLSWPPAQLVFVGASGGGQLRWQGSLDHKINLKVDLPSPFGSIEEEFHVDAPLQWDESESFTPFLLDDSVVLSGTFGVDSVDVPVDVDVDMPWPFSDEEITGVITLRIDGQVTATMSGESIDVAGAGQITSEGQALPVSPAGAFYEPTVTYNENLVRTLTLQVTVLGGTLEFMGEEYDISAQDPQEGTLIDETRDLNFNTETPRFDLPASTVHVDDMNTTGEEDGTQDHPFDTIQEAVNAVADGGTVKVAQGTYHGDLIITGRTITLQGGYPGGTYPGTGDFDDARRDPNPATNNTAIDGQGGAITCQGAGGGSALLLGVKVRNGGANFRGNIQLKRVIAAHD